MSAKGGKGTQTAQCQQEAKGQDKCQNPCAPVQQCQDQSPKCCPDPCQDPCPEPCQVQQSGKSGKK